MVDNTVEIFLKKFSDFAMTFIGLTLAAIPFVIFGVVVSILIANYVKPSSILKYKSKNVVVSHIQSMFIGLFLPVCECGNIPLAKRLSLVGFRPSEVITFMLAAPIFNPIVLVTTLVAFNLDYNVAILRIFIGAFIALFVGLVFSFSSDQKSLLVETTAQKTNFSFSQSQDFQEECFIDNSSLIDSFRDEFFNVFKMLLIGCFVASIFQILIPRELFNIFANSPTLSVLALIALAFVISICSSIDAFFALSLASVFNLGSIIAFLVFGPMIDIKSLMMLSTIFRPKTLAIMSLLVTILSLIAGLSVNYFYKTNYF